MLGLFDINKISDKEMLVRYAKKLKGKRLFTAEYELFSPGPSSYLVLNYNKYCVEEDYLDALTIWHVNKDALVRRIEEDQKLSEIHYILSIWYD